MKKMLSVIPSLLLALSLGLVGWAQAGGPVARPLAVGSGPGVHSPDSLFAPLPARADVLPWSVLTQVKTHTVNNRVLPLFPDSVKALNDTTQRIQGFMLPLEPGEKQKHFLLTSVPLTCSFCQPGGPESMVEVRTNTPIAYSMVPVTVEGKLDVLGDDSQGLYYRMLDVVKVK